MMTPTKRGPYIQGDNGVMPVGIKFYGRHCRPLHPKMLYPIVPGCSLPSFPDLEPSIINNDPDVLSYERPSAMWYGGLPSMPRGPLEKFGLLAEPLSWLGPSLVQLLTGSPLGIPLSLSGPHPPVRPPSLNPSRV
jgi:hypothetical protein